jgi:uroporphyrinogen decarboxylase
MRVLLKRPKPDIENFKETILRKKVSQRVPFVELAIDTEIIKYITEKELQSKWVEPSLKDRKAQEECLKNYINCLYYLGYDFIQLSSDFRFSAGLFFPSKVRKGKDTAFLTRGVRNWVEESKGMINSWEDFEKYPWPFLDKINLSIKRQSYNKARGR